MALWKRVSLHDNPGTLKAGSLSPKKWAVLTKVEDYSGKKTDLLLLVFYNWILKITDAMKRQSVEAIFTEPTGSIKNWTSSRGWLQISANINF